MKKFIALICIVVLLLASCKKQQTNYVQIMTSNKWKLVEYTTTNGIVLSKDPVPDSPSWNIHLTLQFNYLHDSVFLANMIVNDQLGKYYTSNTNNKLSFVLGPGSLVIDNSPWDSLFIATLPNITNFDVTNTDLKLYYNGNNRYMHFVNDSI